MIRGYRIGVIEPATVHSFQPTGPIRVSLEVITPSQGGITPEQWKQATLCPLDWPTNGAFYGYGIIPRVCINLS